LLHFERRLLPKEFDLTSIIHIIPDPFSSPIYALSGEFATIVVGFGFLNFQFSVMKGKNKQ
jgi:hypothetical protein